MACNDKAKWRHVAVEGCGGGDDDGAEIGCYGFVRLGFLGKER